MAKVLNNEIHILNAKGKPFESQQEAADFIRKEEIDATRYVPFANPQGNGWVVLDLAKLAEEQNAEARGAKRRQVNPLNVGPWHKVVFQNKRDENDTDDVFVGVDGVQRFYPREEEVIISDAFMQAVKQAVYTKWTHEPGKGRKSSRPIMRYPFNSVAAATREEFMAFEQQLAARVKAGARGQPAPRAN